MNYTTRTLSIIAITFLCTTLTVKAMGKMVDIHKAIYMIITNNNDAGPTLSEDMLNSIIQGIKKSDPQLVTNVTPNESTLYELGDLFKESHYNFKDDNLLHTIARRISLDTTMCKDHIKAYRSVFLALYDAVGDSGWKIMIQHKNAQNQTPWQSLEYFCANKPFYKELLKLLRPNKHRLPRTNLDFEKEESTKGSKQPALLSFMKPLFSAPVIKILAFAGAAIPVACLGVLAWNSLTIAPAPETAPTDQP